MDLILHVLVNIPEAYNTQLTKIESLLGTQPDSAMIEMMYKKLNTRYGRLKRNRNSDAQIKHKRALFVAASEQLPMTSEEETAYSVSQFKGKCYKCGK